MKARVIQKRRTPARKARKARVAKSNMRQKKRISRQRALPQKPQTRQVTTKRASLQVLPNLLVTYDPNKSHTAKKEVQHLLETIRESPRIEETEISGIFQVTVQNPREAIKKLANLCKESANQFSCTFHWTPIDRWCKSDTAEMQHAIKSLADDIRDDEKWKMLIEKRHFDMHERDLIKSLTTVVNKPRVDLDNPDKIIKVDILGTKAGISLLKKDEWLNVSNYK